MTHGALRDFTRVREAETVFVDVAPSSLILINERDAGDLADLANALSAKGTTAAV